MANEIVTVPTGLVVNPATGNTLDLANETTDLIAGEKLDVTRLKADLTDYAHVLDSALTSRLDKANVRSARVGRFSLETKAPTTEDYPVEALSDALDALIEAGKLEPDVKAHVLVPQPPPPPKVDRREIAKLRKHVDPLVREAVAGCAVEHPQRRPVTVKAVGE